MNHSFLTFLQRYYPILLSILAALVTMGMKTLAYWLTDSVGLLSDAAESLVNLLAAVTAFLSLMYAARPVDASHTYGHEKIEFFSSGLEGTLILVAAGLIAWAAVPRLFFPEKLQSLDIGVLLAGLASVLNFAVARLLIRVGRQRESIILEADGQHLMTDVWTSVAVLAGLGVVWMTGWHILDPIIALLVAANIVWTGGKLLVRSFNGLMDHALPDEEQHRVRRAIEAQLNDDMAYHALRTRQAGAHRFADFHLLVPGNYTVHQAHEVANRIEQAVEAALPGLEVAIHIEPIEEQCSWMDSPLLPIEREARADPPRE
ncbi:MAG: cation diffusion facilitator family transporter [Gemmataceae bacterium]